MVTAVDFFILYQVYFLKYSFRRLDSFLSQLLMGLKVPSYVRALKAASPTLRKLRSSKYIIHYVDVKYHKRGIRLDGHCKKLSSAIFRLTSA